MNDLQIFNNEGFEVRAVEKDGEPWFVAKDVVLAMEYEKFDSHLIDKIPDDWKGTNQIRTPGCLQEMVCLSEQGLYFFLSRADKPRALPFQKWIAGEVIPSIRKTGAYIAAPKTYLEALEALVKSEKEKLRLQAENTGLKPKADFFDAVADSKDALQMRDVAEVLNLYGWGRNAIFSLLRKKDVLDGRNIPYREYQDQGYFRVVEREWTDKGEETRISLKTLVCQRGVDFIRKLIREAA